MVAEFASKWGDANKFLLTFAPDKQHQYCKRELVDRCFCGGAPELSKVAAAYGDGTAEAWLGAQITDLSLFAGANNIELAQMDELARVIKTSYYHLKVTELMYFFLRFKSGAYGKFYGKVDALTITDALDSFLGERREILARIESEKRKEQWLREMEASQRTAISREAYDRLPNIRIYINAKANERTLKRIKDHFHLCGISVNGECSKRCTEQDLAELRECEKRGFLKIREIQELPKC